MAFWRNLNKGGPSPAGGQKSYQLCLEVYRITKGFPKMEIYGLISQMRRAALSIPSNIAEGSVARKVNLNRGGRTSAVMEEKLLSSI